MPQRAHPEDTPAFERDKEFVKGTLYEECPSCGGQLEYSAEKQRIVCPYCGYEEEFDRANDQVVERSLAEAARAIRQWNPGETGRKLFECHNCGARVLVEPEDVQIRCGFCGSENINVQAIEQKFIKPVGIIPFYVSRDQALERFKQWLRQGWFHPDSLRKLARVEELHGIYLPFWTYDAQTESDWEGYAGYYYYVTRTVMRNGKPVMVQERRIRWVYRSGHLSHFFDDVLVPASGGLSPEEVAGIEPFRLNELVNFDPRLMMGWEAEVYKIEVDEGYQIADRIMDHRIRQMCSAQLGGDTQRNLRIHSRKFNQTFKLVVLPVWIASYEYKGKRYHFMINGQTGKVSGAKPLSWVKIFILVLAFAAILALLWYLREQGVLAQ